MRKSNVLFKYRSIDKASLELFINRQLWFAQPKTLNDPFECQEISHDIFDFVWRHYEITDNQKKRLHKKLNNQLDVTGICSFSTAKKNQLMWSHYADEHKGCCIGFNVTNLALTENFINKIEVKYQPSYPYKEVVDRIKNYECDDPIENNADNIANDILYSLIRTKYSYWKYEREVRLVKQHFGAHKFNPTAVSSITFGLRTSDRDIATIKALLSSKEWKHVRYFKAYKSKSKFALEFKNI